MKRGSHNSWIIRSLTLSHRWSSLNKIKFEIGTSDRRHHKWWPKFVSNRFIHNVTEDLSRHSVMYIFLRKYSKLKIVLAAPTCHRVALKLRNRIRSRYSSWHFLRQFSEILRLFSDHKSAILRLANQIEERLGTVFEFCSRQNTTRNNFLYPKNWEWRTFPLSISKTMFDLLLDVIWRLLESKYRSWKDRKFK